MVARSLLVASGSVVRDMCRIDNVEGRDTEAKHTCRKKWYSVLGKELMQWADMLKQGERQTPCKKQRTSDEQPSPPGLAARTKDTVHQNVKNWYSDTSFRLQGMHMPQEDEGNIGSQCALCAHTYK
jgi:hypothetical protein